MSHRKDRVLLGDWEVMKANNSAILLREQHDEIMENGEGQGIRDKGHSSLKQGGGTKSRLVYYYFTE